MMFVIKCDAIHPDLFTYVASGVTAATALRKVLDVVALDDEEEWLDFDLYEVRDPIALDDDRLRYGGPSVRFAVHRLPNGGISIHNLPADFSDTEEMI